MRLAGISAFATTTVFESSRMDAAVTDAESEGSAKVMVRLLSPDVMTEGETVKLPVMNAGETTDTVTLGGWPLVPDWTVTPEWLVTRTVNVVVASGLTSAEPLALRVMLPGPLTGVMVALAVAGVKETPSEAVVPAVIVVDGAPEAVKLVITGLALSTCRVPLAVAPELSPAVSVAVSAASPSSRAVVFTSKAYSGAAAATVEAGKFTLPEASVTLRTPEVARAETRTRTVPLRKSAGACPSTPVIATEELAAVPATHFPPDPQTG